MPSLTPLNGQSFLFLGQVLVGFVLALALSRRLRSYIRTLLIVPWAFQQLLLPSLGKWILNGVYGYLPNLIVKLGLMNHVPGF